MTKKATDILIIAIFGLLIAGFFVAQLLLPDRDISIAERRRLAQKPPFTAAALLSGEFMTGAEEYFADQFPLRQELRTVKAAWQFGAFRQKDNNGIYIAHGSVFKLTGETEEAQVNALVSRVNSVCETYLSGLKVYFAAIPDKGRQTAAENGYPTLDYERMDALLSSGLDGGINYLGFDPCSALTAEDYYKTDLHWRQERLQPVVDALGAAMGFAPADISKYSAREISPFYGVYCGQSALDVGYDTIRCLSSAAVDAAAVTGLDFDGEKAVYDQGDFDSMDRYDIFLGGPQTVEVVENPKGHAGRELYIFRDSFASALAPLLLESYDRITLIDLRYIGSGLLGDYVDFTPGADVLFLYSTEVINNGMILK